jgi:hypothetical protein
VVKSWPSTEPKVDDRLANFRGKREQHSSKSVHQGDALLEPVTVGPDEFEDTAAELARSVQIVSRLPDQFARTR